MNVELRHLRYFLALAEAKSFSRAATALGIAQPGLSQQIRKLESELDVVLFVRGNDGSHPTAAGLAFLPGARRSVAEAADAVAAAREAGRGVSGRLHVGFVGSSAYDLIPTALRRYRNERPDIEVSLIETDATHLSECFERHELDLAFVRRPVDDQTLLTELVSVDDVVAVLPETHPLRGRLSLPLSALANDMWVLPPVAVSKASRQMFLADCGSSGFQPTIVAEAATPEATIGLVAAGLGVSMLPQDPRLLLRAGICSVPIQRMESVVVMAWREARRTPAVSDFMRLIRQIAQSQAARDSRAARRLTIA
jgi:DNA-binding transcriptional LysR family regulator